MERQIENAKTINELGRVKMWEAKSKEELEVLNIKIQEANERIHSVSECLCDNLGTICDKHTDIAPCMFV
jgi:hypothetical protein